MVGGWIGRKMMGVVDGDGCGFCVGGGWWGWGIWWLGGKSEYGFWEMELMMVG